MNNTTSVRILFTPDKSDYSGMNFLRRNLTYLMGAKNLATPQALAEAAGPSYSTIYRILNDDDYTPGSKTLDQLSAYFSVPGEDLRRKDITNDARLKRDVVHVRMLDGFELPSGPLFDHYHWLDDPIAFPRSWFLFNVGIEPEFARFAVKRNQSNRAELSEGSIAIIDTRATDVEAWGVGLYAYTYHNVRDIKKLTWLPAQNVLRISGSEESKDLTELQGKELEKFVIHGKVLTKITPSRV